MSTADQEPLSSPEPDFDLDKLFLPAWAKKPAAENQYAEYSGETERRDDRRRDRGDRPMGRGDRDRRDRPPRPPGAPGGPGGFGGPRGPREGGGPRPPRPEGAPPRDRLSFSDRRRERGPDRGPDRRHDRPPREEKPVELPPVNVSLIPEEIGVDSLARQIKMTGRAYPLFEIAVMVLDKPERHTVTLSVRKNPEGAVIQPLFVCALDETVWLTEDEAVRYVLDRHFTTFYQADRTQIDPPKGTYTFVAQCGMSGAILGPPNYHGYQEQLRKLHQERFSRMPFEVFKARVRIVRDEAVVKKWVEEQSWKTEFICLNLPEPLRLGSRDEVEKHFRQTHLANIIGQAETVHLSGAASRRIRQPELARLIRVTWEQQRRFPLQVATVLSQQFASRGLQFFKVNRSFTHVAAARPRYLDLEATPVSEGVRRIVDFINANPKCNRRQLVESLAPRPKPVVPEGEPAPAAAAAVASEPTPEETQVVIDLHWLVHQGHVIEFANGVLETAKKPVPKPPKPSPAPAPAGEAAPAEGATVATPPVSADTPAPAADGQAPMAPPTDLSAEGFRGPEPEPEAPPGPAPDTLPPTTPAGDPEKPPEPVA